MLRAIRFVGLLFAGILVLVVVMVGKARANSGEKSCLVRLNHVSTAMTVVDTTSGASIDIETPYGAVLRKLKVPIANTKFLFATDTSDVYEIYPEDGNIVLVSFDKKTGEHHVTGLGFDDMITISADGNYLSTNNDIYSQSLVRIYTLPDLQVEYTHYRRMNTPELSNLHWSNSGHLFAFLERNEANEALLTIVDAETLHSTSVMVIPHVSEIPSDSTFFQWSDDDEAIVVNINTTIAIYFPRDNTLKQVADGQNYRLVGWIKNTHQLVYTVSTDQRRIDLWVYDADTDVHTIIASQIPTYPWYSDDRSHVILTTTAIDTPSTLLVNLLTHEQHVVRSDASTIRNVDWLDGTRIAVAYDDKLIGMNEDGSDRHEVDMIAGQYSPYLLLHHLMPYQVWIDGKAELGVIDFNSGTRRKLGSPDDTSLYLYPSPDGRTIAHITFFKGTKLSLFASDGSQSTSFEANRDNGFNLFWSPDSTRVALVLNGPKTIMVHILTATGEHLKTIELPVDTSKIFTGWTSCEIPEPALF